MDPHFDPEAMPNLLGFLWDRYRARIESHLDARGAATPGAVTRVLDRAPATAFLTFATDYMTRHRVVQAGPADANMVLYFDDGARVLACPGQAPGGMQAAGAVPITDFEDRPTGKPGAVPI